MIKVIVFSIFRASRVRKSDITWPGIKATAFGNCLKVQFQYTTYSIRITVYRTVSPMVMVLVTELVEKQRILNTRRFLWPSWNSFSRIRSIHERLGNTEKQWNESCDYVTYLFFFESIKEYDIERSARFPVCLYQILIYRNFDLSVISIFS